MNWNDKLTTRLNACSLETLYSSTKHHIHCPATQRQQPPGASYPLVIGCYQLNEGENQESSEGSSRSGALLLHSIEMSPESMLGSATKIKFGEAHNIIDTDAGILDGKWLQSRPFRFTSTATNGNDNTKDNSGNDNLVSTLEETESCFMYATATASGSIDIYRLVDNRIPSKGEGDQTESTDVQKVSYRLEQETTSKDNDNIDSDSKDDNGLALSLAWDEFNANPSTCQDKTRIVSSYSNGSIAVHNVQQSSSSSLMMEETHRWKGHTLFGCPSEVWTSCFANNRHYNTYGDTIISGGDDCILKLWDLRTCNSCGGGTPATISSNKDFEAGVTAVAYHPTMEHYFAVGSYDEYVRIWDMRKVGPRAEPLVKVHVEGGVWRIKWHPKDSDRILVGAMHGGCRIVQVASLETGDEGGDNEAKSGIESNITAEFTEHKSMAYGADWLYHATDKIEAAASCSFYDRQAFIWESA